MSVCQFLITSLLASLMALLQGASQAGPSSGWSLEVNGLQARLTIVDKGEWSAGRRWLVPFLELRNVSGGALDVNLDRGQLRMELVGKEGQPLGLRPTPGHSGPAPRLGTLILPHDSSISISLEVRGWIVSNIAAAIVDSRGEGFEIRAQEKGNVFLRATITGEAGISASGQTWNGTLQTPLVTVDWQ